MIDINREKLHAGVYGLAVGDALGVPYEFRERGTFLATGMTGMGMHRQPAGTWSDDTAMTLATLDSLNRCGWRVDVDDLRARFILWMRRGAYTVDGEKFDIGRTTATALRTGKGQTGEHDNGNGSLMRILPLAFKPDVTDGDVANVSAVTHAHRLSVDACIRYVRLVRGLLDGKPFMDAAHAAGVDYAAGLNPDELDTSGFVTGTLEAAVYCLANTRDYHDAVLSAVNLGEDTDTVAAVTGGLAGVYYGYDAIPTEWVDALRGKDIINRAVM